MTDSVKICMILGHRYGPQLISGIVKSPEYQSRKIELSKVLCVHPSVADITGGYDSSEGLLEKQGIAATYFYDVNDSSVIKELKQQSPRFILVAGLRQIIPQSILDIPRLMGGSNLYSHGYGCIGFHPSKLPYGPGMSPVQHSILEGSDSVDLSSFMITKDQWDAGPVLLQSGNQMDALKFDAGDAHTEICKLAEKMSFDLASQLASGRLEYTPQNLKGRQFRRALITPDRWIDFSRSCDEISKLVRAFSPPYRGAFFRYDGASIYVWKVREFPNQSRQKLALREVHVDGDRIFVGCGDGSIEILEYTYQQKKPQFVTGRVIHGY